MKKKKKISIKMLVRDLTEDELKLLRSQISYEYDEIAEILNIQLSDKRDYSKAIHNLFKEMIDRNISVDQLENALRETNSIQVLETLETIVRSKTNITLLFYDEYAFNTLTRVIKPNNTTEIGMIMNNLRKKEGMEKTARGFDFPEGDQITNVVRNNANNAHRINVVLSAGGRGQLLQDLWDYKPRLVYLSLMNLSLFDDISEEEFNDICIKYGVKCVILSAPGESEILEMMEGLNCLIGMNAGVSKSEKFYFGNDFIIHLLAGDTFKEAYSKAKVPDVDISYYFEDETGLY